MQGACAWCRAPGLTLRLPPAPSAQAQQLAAQVAQMQDLLQQERERSAQQLAPLAQAVAQVERFKAQWQQEFNRRRRLHDQVGAGQPAMPRPTAVLQRL